MYRVNIDEKWFEAEDTKRLARWLNQGRITDSTEVIDSTTGRTHVLADLLAPANAHPASAADQDPVQDVGRINDELRSKLAYILSKPLASFTKQESDALAAYMNTLGKYVREGGVDEELLHEFRKRWRRMDAELRIQWARNSAGEENPHHYEAHKPEPKKSSTKSGRKEEAKRSSAPPARKEEAKKVLSASRQSGPATPPAPTGPSREPGAEGKPVKAPATLPGMIVRLVIWLAVLSAISEANPTFAPIADFGMVIAIIVFVKQIITLSKGNLPAKT